MLPLVYDQRRVSYCFDPVRRTVLIVFTAIGPAFTTDCAQLSQKEALQQSQLVFRGKVTRIQDVGSVEERNPQDKIPVSRFGQGDPQLVDFHAERTWKGKAGKTVKIFVFRRPPLGDGYTFQPGKEYIVYSPGKINATWKPLVDLAGTEPVWELGACILRVRTDVEQEVRVMEKGSRAAPRQ